MKIDVEKVSEIMKEDKYFCEVVESAFRYYLARRVDWLIKEKHGVSADFYPQFFEYPTDRRREPKLQKIAAKLGLVEFVESKKVGTGVYQVLPEILEVGSFIMDYPDGGFDPEAEAEKAANTLLRGGRTREFLNSSVTPTQRELYAWLVRPDLFEDGVVMHTYDQRFKGTVTEPFSWIRPAGFESRLWESQRERVRLGMLQFDSNLFEVVKNVSGEEAAKIAEEQLPKFMTMDWEHPRRHLGVRIDGINSRIHFPENADEAYNFVSEIGSLLESEIESCLDSISALEARVKQLERLHELVGPDGFELISKELERDINETIYSPKVIGMIEERIAKNYREKPFL